MKRGNFKLMTLALFAGRCVCPTSARTPEGQVHAALAGAFPACTPEPWRPRAHYAVYVLLFISVNDRTPAAMCLGLLSAHAHDLHTLPVSVLGVVPALGLHGSSAINMRANVAPPLLTEPGPRGRE